MADEITRIVTQLVVDAVGARSGVADFEASMKKARKAYEDTGESGKSFDSVQKRWTQSLAATDPVLKAQIKMMNELEKQSRIGSEAVKLGITTQAAHTQQLEMVRQKYQGYVTDAQRAARATSQVGTEAGAVTGQLIPMLRLFAAIAGVQYAKSIFDGTAALSEQAQQLTVSVEALQAYRAQFLVNGVSVEQGNTLIQRFSKSVGEAKNASGPARAAFADLGVTFEDLSSTEGGLAKAAAGLLAMKDANERARLEAALFGRSGMALEPVLQSLAQPIDVLIAKGKALGIVLSEDMAKRADDASDKIALSFARLKGVLAPIFADIADGVASIFDNPNVRAIEKQLTDRAEAGAKRFKSFIAEQRAGIVTDRSGFPGDAASELSTKSGWPTENFDKYLKQQEQSAHLASLSAEKRAVETAWIEAANAKLKDQYGDERHIVSSVEETAKVLSDQERSRIRSTALIQYQGDAANKLRLEEERKAKALQNQIIRGQDNLDILNAEISLIGKSNLERAKTLAQLQARKELGLKSGEAPSAAQQEYIDLVVRQAKATVALRNETDLYNESLSYQLDLLDQIDSSTRSAASSMVDAFGNVGKAIGDVATTLTGYAAQQASFMKDQKALDKLTEDGFDTRQAQILLTRKAANAEEQYYSDMLSSAKGFFGEKTAAYKVLQAVEGTYNAFRLAGNLMTMASDIQAAATKAATVPTIVASNQAIAASGVTAGAAQIFAELGPWGFPVVAAMMAVMLGLGFGSGSSASTPKVDTTAKDRQAAQGSGSVLGDAAAKSDSIAKSLDQLAKNANRDLEYSSQMVTSLRAIQNSIGSVSAYLAGQLTGGGKFDSSNLALGTSSRIGTQTGGATIGGMFSYSSAAAYFPVDPIGAIAGLLGGVFGKTKTTTTLQDEGIKFAATTVGKAMTEGAAAIYQQVEVVKRSTALFGLISSTKTTSETLTGALPDSLQSQITGIIGQLRGTVVDAATKLGVSGAAALVDSLSINLGSISFKDMTGEQIQEALNAVFSKLGDDMALTAAPFLSSLQKVGEGALETLSRVVNEVMVVSDAAKSMGLSFNLTGMSAITASDRLVQLAGDLDTFASQSQFFIDNFLTSAQALAPIQKAVADEMARLNAAGVVSKEQFAALVQGIDVSTESGAALYTALMNVAPAFAKVADAADELASKRMDMEIELLQATGDAAGATALQRQKELAALDATLVPLQKQIYAAEDLKAANDNLAAANEAAAKAAEQAAQAAAQAAEQRARELKTANDNLAAAQKTLNDLINPQIDTAANLAAAHNDLSAAYQAESSSLQTTIDRYRGFASSLTEYGNSLTGSSGSGNILSQYATARALFQQTANLARGGDVAAIENLQSVSENFLTASKAAAVSSSAYSADLAAVKGVVSATALQATSIADNAQAQLNALNNSVKGLGVLNDSVLSVRDAISNLTIATAADEASKAEAIAIARANVASAQAALNAIPGHASGLSNVPYDNYLMRAHAGEAVLTRGEADRWRGGYSNDNSEVVAELRALRAEVAELKAASQGTEKNTKKTSTILTRVTEDGESVKTVAA